MRSYIEILTEAKDRFIKKNKNLSSEQQEYFIDAVKKYKNFERLIDKEIGWNKVHKIKDYELSDLLDRARDTKSSKKKKAKKLRHKGISGLTEGEDYINIKTKNPYYLAYLPLNYKAAQVIKTSHIGGCTHDGCIGSSEAPKYFRLEGKKKKRVPVYVIGEGEKYVVMMYPANKNTWETWRKENRVGESGEIIPNFSIKKELTTPKLMALYKDVLYNTWSKKGKGQGIPQEEYDDAEEAYDDMVADIESHLGERIRALEYHHEHNDEVWKYTIELYKEKIIELNIDLENLDKNANKVKEKLAGIKKIIEVEPTGTGTNSHGEVVWNLRGVDYTMEDLIKVHKDTIKSLEDIDEDGEEWAEIKEEIDEANTIIDTLEDFGAGGYEFEEWALEGDGQNVEFSDDVYSEESALEGIYQGIDFRDRSYDPYFSFAEDYLDQDDDRDDLNMSFYEFESDSIYGGGDPDGEAIMDDLGLEHPEEAQKDN